MKRTVLLLFVMCSLYTKGQNTNSGTPRMVPEMTEFYTPLVKVVTPGKPVSNEILVQPPSDAIVLFDGKDLSQWEKAPARNAYYTIDEKTHTFNFTTGIDAKWDVKDGIMTVNKREGDIQTRKSFGDFQLHAEWFIPKDITGQDQARGNSGILIQGVYELQIMDSYKNDTYVDGMVGSIYKQSVPLANPMYSPGNWNTYDIIYTAPVFREDGTFKTPPYITVLLNGVLVEHNTAILGPTQYIGIPRPTLHGKGPIRLQAHGDRSEPISFRNIWIREL